MRLAPVVAVVLASCTAAPAAVPVYPGESHAVRVIDGDTFELDGETIRISNIDAPESPPRAGCWAEARLAVEAKVMLEMLSNAWSASPPVIVREGDDRYGRTLARISDQPAGVGQDVGERMIEAGLAVPWTGRQWEWCGPVSDQAAGATLLGPKATVWGSLAYAPSGEAE